MPSVYDVFPTLKARSELPSGGRPLHDLAYEAWRGKFVAAANRRWLDRKTRFGHDLPGRELIEDWRLDEHLFLATGGTRLWASPNHYHRRRHLGIVFRDRRPFVVRAAQEYAAKRAAMREEQR